MSATDLTKTLHKHLMDLRNQPSPMATTAYFLDNVQAQTMGDMDLPVMLGINVKSMYGINRAIWLLRYEKQSSVCDSESGTASGLECEELTPEANATRRI